MGEDERREEACRIHWQLMRERGFFQGGEDILGPTWDKAVIYASIMYKICQ
jgi:hypothetical protein